ncbi:putative immune-type receptor 14b [Alligator mississippiensis]|uniref:Immune-type receptor 14b n=1 Tax=Alligator mississippiensis TaxID=8496 RepID=A0A151NL36_ALLMI|nr:putative immune-type receptor 14b [Alligator mississippiensis]
MWRCLLLSTLLLWRQGFCSVYVEQPPFLTGVPGATTPLQCTLIKTSHYHMFWYRQRAGRELEALFYSAGVGETSFTKEPMEAKKNGSDWTLTWKSLSHSDSAVYYCACSDAQ